MKRYAITAVLVLVLALCLCVGASAATKLPNYTLVYEGEPVELSLKTGYLFRQGSYPMVPMEQVAKLAGLACVTDDKDTQMTITRADGKKVEIRLNYKKIRVDGRMQTLRARVQRQDGGILTADVRILKALGLEYKHYKASKALKALGYKSGAVAFAKAGGDLTLPDMNPEPSPEFELPAALKEAAKTATQIVGVKYSKNGTRLTLYENNNGTWSDAFSTAAYVGSEGIGKTREGDKKTPTGTYNLTKPFGIKSLSGVKLGSYLKVNKNHYWSGQNGEYYNQLVDVSKVKGYKPTSDDEHLIDYKVVYNYACFIDYNAEGVAGKGSAIFLHCKGSKNYTAGCIAVSEDVMKALLGRLTPGAKIVIYS